MAADFNAGSIEGTLELNNAPFKAGLAEARLQAAQFEGKDIAPTADLNKAKFDAKKDVAEADLTKLDHTKVEPKAGLDIKDFVAKYAILNKLLNPGGLSGDGKGIFGMSLGAAKITSMIGGIMGLVAAAGPATGVLAAFGTAGAAAFGGVAVSMGLFAAAAKSAFGELTKANKAGVTLTGWAGTAQKAMKDLTTEWHNLINSAHAGVMRDLALGMNMIAAILPKLAPLLRVTAQGVGGVLRHVNALAHSKLFDQFLSSLEKFMGGFLKGAGPVLTNILKTFMGIFIQMQPLMAVIGHGIERASAAVAHFATGNGLRTFLGYVAKEGPKVFALLSGIVHGLMNLGKGLAPLAGPALHFLTALVHAIGGIHIAPLAKGFGQVFTALEPLLGVLKTLLNVILKPLGHLLGAIATGPIHQLTHGLQGELKPAFHALRGILHDLVKPLAAFAGSIANLANPTGVHLVVALLKALRGAVHQLAPSLSKLAVALENVVDDGLMLIIPLLPTLGGLLTFVVNAITPLVSALGNILSHKAVVDVIIGLVAAFKGLQIVFAIVKGIQAFMAAFATFQALAEAEGIMAGIAAVSPALAAGIDMIGVAIDFATGPIGLIIIGIAALAAGLIYAYKHSKTFRDIVNGAFHAVAAVAKSVFHWLEGAVTYIVDFIKSHWQLLLGILTGPIGAAVIFLISHWDQIRNGFSTLMSDVVKFVSDGITTVVSWFEGLPGKIVGFVGKMVDAGKALMGGIFHGLESVATAVGGFAANIAQSIWHELEGVLNNVLPHSLHLSIFHHGITVPLFPMLAGGGVTDGPMLAGIGDNPGGKEAVVPLDKYDIPRKGEVSAIATRAERDNARIINLLQQLVYHASSNGTNKDLIDGLTKSLGDHQTVTMRAALQAARAR